MITGRGEGTVLIVLLTVSTIVMMTIMGVCCVIGNKHYKLYCNRMEHAEVMLMESDMREEEHSVRMRAFLA